MNENDIEIMLQRTIEMKTMVLDYSDKLHKTAESINGALADYMRAGLPSEVARYIYVENEKDCEDINKLCLMMQTDHVGYLDKMIVKFNEILNRSSIK